MQNGTRNGVHAALTRHMAERRYLREEILYMPGDPGRTLFVVKTGRIQQYHLSPEGRKLVVAVLHPGDLFGITSFTRESRHHLFAEALEDSVVWTLHRRAVEERLLQDPALMCFVIDQLARRLIQAQRTLHELAFDSIPVRLARCLLETARGGIVSGYSHQELGELLGTYRETVTLILNRFKSEGLIDIGRRRIVILDPVGLARIADGGNGADEGTAWRVKVPAQAARLAAVA